MLQAVRLLVDLVPPVAQRAHQVGLDQAVVADHFEGDLDSLGGEPGPVVGVVDDEAQRCELAEHLAHRSRADPHLLGEAGVGHDGLGSARDAEQRLEVVLLGGRCSAVARFEFWHA